MDRQRKKILVVDDEQDIAEILQFNLRAEGYDVDVALSAEEALPMIQAAAKGVTDRVQDSSQGQSQGQSRSPYDLLLLDVMMGEISGFGLASLLKRDAATADVPIVFITALDGEDETVKGLDIGADDYIPKPLSMKEVKARVRAVLRRCERPRGETAWCEISQGEKNRLCFEGIAVDLAAKTVMVDDKTVTLTHLEFELLAFFLQHQGRVYSRDELINRLWPRDAFVMERTVDVNLTRLRKKIAPYGEHIKTKIGYGYYLSL